MLTTIHVFTQSLGCPKNLVDTEHLLGAIDLEIIPVESVALADLVLINTCAFIESAVRESIANILEIIEDLKALHPKPLLVVAGCLVERYGKKVLAEELVEVDLFLPSSEILNWPRALCDLLHTKSKTGRLLSTGPSYAWLKIAEGCKHNCAFCTIPSIRGRLQSVEPDILLAEAANLVQQGVQELVLVAQDTTAYGADLGLKLEDLLTELVKLPKLSWLRLMYLYPAGLTDNLLSFIAANQPRILPYFDIPLQHSHPEILVTMGRPFANDPRFILDRVRKFVPNAIFRTTFIVGYPGETAAHFEHLCKFVQEEKFMHVGVFTYEREEKTQAYNLPNQVPRNLAHERRDYLLTLQQNISSELLSNYLGEKLDVLVDSANEEWDGLYNGRVWFQAPEVDGQTYVSGEDVHVGKIVQGEIIENTAYDLTALA